MSGDKVKETKKAFHHKLGLITRRRHADGHISFQMDEDAFNELGIEIDFKEVGYCFFNVDVKKKGE
jgi:hypothetical protein